MRGDCCKGQSAGSHAGRMPWCIQPCREEICRLDAEGVIPAGTGVQQRALAECSSLQHPSLDHGLITNFGI